MSTIAKTARSLKTGAVNIPVGCEPPKRRAERSRFVSASVSGHAGCIEEVTNVGKLENGEIDDVKSEGEWEVVSIKLDSGAFDWVFNPATASAFAIEETTNSNRGLNYVAANGSAINNYGQRRIKGFTGDLGTCGSRGGSCRSQTQLGVSHEDHECWQPNCAR